MLEHNLLNCEKTCEQLEKEVNEVSSQLQFREKEKETQLDEIEAWRSQALSFSSEKKELEVCVCCLWNKLGFICKFLYSWSFQI